MSQKGFSKFLSILMGLLMGLVALFFIIAFLFPNLNLPSLRDLLETENRQQIRLEESEEKIRNDLEVVEVVSEELQLISLTSPEDDTNAWDLLLASHEVLYQEYDFGVFIEEINGLRGDQDNFWAIYVNDESSLVGIQDIMLNEGDIIELRYEAIKK